MLSEPCSGSVSADAPSTREPLASTVRALLGRSAEVHPDKTAVIHGSRRLTYRELADEAQRLADALRSAGVAPGDRVAYLLPNVPELVVAHFGWPLAGAALVAMNTRLASEEIRYICDHAEAVVLVVDDEQAPIAINYTSGTTGRPKGVV